MRASSLAFFFFQAEDGIRDLVTGVQTCALPSDPAIPVVRNVDAGVTRTAAEVKTFLLQQVASPVRWTDCVLRLAVEGASTFVEVGPERVLTGLLRRIVAGVRDRKSVV